MTPQDIDCPSSKKKISDNHCPLQLKFCCSFHWINNIQPGVLSINNRPLSSCMCFKFYKPNHYFVQQIITATTRLSSSLIFIFRLKAPSHIHPCSAFRQRIRVTSNTVCLVPLHHPQSYHLVGQSSKAGKQEASGLAISDRK